MVKLDIVVPAIQCFPPATLFGMVAETVAAGKMVMAIQGTEPLALLAES